MRTPILLALCACSSLALAQQTPPATPTSPTDAFIKELDTDGNGTVSLDEARAPQLERFKEADTDGDGKISAAEARTAFEKHVPAQIMQQMKERGLPDPGETFLRNLDKNADGAVSLDEFTQPAIESFQRMDQNSDGQVSADEARAFFDQMHQQMQERMRQWQEQQGQSGMPAPGGPAQPSMPMMPPSGPQ